MSITDIPLREEQIAAYRRDGYLAIEGVFDRAEIAELQEVTDSLVEGSRAVTSHTAIYDLEPGHSRELPKVRRIKSPHKHHPVYDKLVSDVRILDVVEQLVGSGIRLQDSKLNMKSPGFGSPVEWHQDWAFYPHTNDDLLAVGIAIDDMMLVNGCLMVIPGSQREAVLDHHQKGVFVGAVSAPDLNERAVPVELHAGGISLHHARLVHGSAPNTSSYPRRFLVYEYCSADAWPLMGVSDWDDYHARLVRGGEVAEPRMESVPVRVPWPKPAAHGTIYEIQESFDKGL